MNNQIKKKVAAIIIAAMTIGSVSPAFGNSLSEQEKRERAKEWARFEMETRNLPSGIRNDLRNKFKAKLAQDDRADYQTEVPAYGNGLSEQEKRERTKEWARFEMETRNLPSGIRNELRNKFKAKLAEEDRRSQQAKDDFQAREDAGGWYLPEDKQFSEEEKSIHEANMKNTRESVNQKKESALDKVSNYGGGAVTFAFCLSMTAFVSPNKIVGDDECAKAIKNTCSLKRGYPHPARCAIFPTWAF